LRPRGVPIDERLHNVDTPLAGPVGQGAPQRGGLHLLVDPLRVVARLWAVHHAAAGELGCADRALPGATGALLLVRLPATAGDLAAGLGLVRALARGRELGDHDLVHQRDVGLRVEDVGRQLDTARRLAVDPANVHSAHFAPPFGTSVLAAERSSTRLPL